jgi:hypothetical protein
MYVKYNKDSDSFSLEYSEKDKCCFCEHQSKCPLITALIKEYCLSRFANIPTETFCEAYTPNVKISSLEKSLRKKKKTRER